jgi:hypothetical protein
MNQKYKLVLGDGCYGPGDIGAVTVLGQGVIKGPDLPNWQREGFLVRCLDPTTYRGEELRYLIVSPRYTTDSLSHIQTHGGVVGVARMLPGTYAENPKTFEPRQVEYWAVGALSILKT